MACCSRFSQLVPGNDVSNTDPDHAAYMDQSLGHLRTSEQRAKADLTRASVRIAYR
jgi:hypothetical protein